MHLEIVHPLHQGFVVISAEIVPVFEDEQFFKDSGMKEMFQGCDLDCLKSL